MNSECLLLLFQWTVVDTPWAQALIVEPLMRKPGVWFLVNLCLWGLIAYCLTRFMNYLSERSSGVATIKVKANKPIDLKALAAYLVCFLFLFYLFFFFALLVCFSFPFSFVFFLLWMFMCVYVISHVFTLLVQATKPVGEEEVDHHASGVVKKASWTEAPSLTKWRGYVLLFLTCT